MVDPKDTFTVAGPSASSSVKEACEEALRACRGCLATDARLFPLHAHALADAYGQLLGAPVSQTDGLPQVLCSMCCRLLQNYMDFRARSNAAQSFLRSIHAQYCEFPITTDFIRCLDTSQLKRNLMRCDVQHIDISPVTINVYDDSFQICDDFVEKNEHEDTLQCEKLTFETEVMEELNSNTEAPHLETEKNSTDAEISEANQESTCKNKTENASVKCKRIFLSNEAFATEFANKYNCDVVMLTKEQQIARIEARKETAKFKRAKYKCGLCFKVSSLSSYEKHRLLHDPSRGKFECEVCHVRRRTRKLLSNHSYCHKYNIICKQCNYVSIKMSSAISHYNFHKGNKYECQQCGKMFDKLAARWRHARREHGRARCAQCGATLAGARGLSMHMAMAHKQGMDSRCGGCKLRFHSMDALNAHLDALPDGACDDSARACAQCGQNFPTDALLRAHAQNRHKILYPCDECGKSYKTSTTLAKHACEAAPPRARPRPPRNRMCHVCGYNTYYPTKLKYHMMIHTGEKPHQCTLCPKKYRLPSDLQYHMNMHTGTRPYKCRLCPKAFYKSSVLYAHRLVHTKELRHPCPVCGKRFRSTAYVKTHVRTTHLEEPWPKRARDARKQRLKHTNLSLSSAGDSE